MAFDFPLNPVADQVHTDVPSGATYTFNGTGWTAKGSPVVTPPADFVLKTGDTMTGDLIIAKSAGGTNLWLNY